ncbi:MAG: hypothetical protein KKI08_13955 [Armatimonadetes bacterium]|nr:hypothetical protein [Armatimonadota bacterium]
MTRSLMCLIALLGASLAFAAPDVVALKATAPPVLDGKLDDAIWQQGQWYGNFTLLGEGDKPATAQTRFKVAFDQRNLYLAVEMLEPQMDKVVARETARDGHVHRDDVCEFMIVPSSSRLDYYHFSVNPLRTLYDAERRQGGNVGTVEWDADWQAAIGKTATSWTVEAAIPFTELPLTSLSQGDWAINVARERQVGKAELSSFTEGRGGFHQPNLYATLKLPGADLSRALWTLKPPYETAFEPKGERLFYTGKLHLTNDTGKFWFVRLKPELVSAAGSSAGPAVSAGFDATQSRELAFRVPVREQGPQVLRLTLVDRRHPEEVLCVRKVPLTLAYTPLAVDITQPSYRDCIYATQQITQIEFTVKSALAPEMLAGRMLHAVLVRAGAQSPAEAVPVARATPQPAAPEVKMTLPADKLAVGDYRLIVTLMDKGGQIAHSATKTLRKLPPPPHGHEWRLDEHSVLRHNGQPFMPFGWFSQSPASFDLADGYNVLQAYSKEYFSDEVVREWLDEVVKHGAVATFSPYSRPFMNRDEALKRPLNDAEKQELARRVRALMDHPGLFAWYMADEPELVPVLPQRSQEIYEVVRDTDPYHPCIMLNDTIGGIAQYERGGDVLMPDPYPCFLKGGLAASPLEKTSKFMQAIRDATGGRKGAWVTPQGFNYGDYGRSGNRGPTLMEMRNQAVQAVVGGATGFIWYTHSQINNYPDLWLGMPFLAREMKDLQEAVLAPDVAGIVTVKAPKPEHMHVCARRVGDDLFVFAVNTATEPQDVTLTIKGAPGTLAVVSEGRSVKLDGGAFSDRFDTYESHIYTTRAALANRASLREAQAAIAKAEGARKKPGNVAFEDSGVRVVVSSGTTYGNTPERVVDGITEFMGWTAKEAKGEQWLQLIWPAELQIGRVVAYSTSLAEAEVQVPGAAEGEWRTVGKLAGDGPLSATFAPVKVKTLRLMTGKLRGEARLPGLQEVEAYAQ